MTIPAAPPAASVGSPRATTVACPSDPETPPPLPTATVTFEGGPSLTVELAKAPRETERGLMYRTSMPE